MLVCVAGRRHRWDPRCDPPKDLHHPVPIDPAGRHGPTRSQASRAGTARSPWRRTSTGLFVPSFVDADRPEQRVVEAAALLPAHGAVTGWASLRMHGAYFCDGTAPDGMTAMPVPLVVGPHQSRRARDGVVWLQDRIDATEVWIRQGVPVTAPDRATFDAMRKAADVREALVALEMAMAAELTSITRMLRYVDAHAGWAGVAQARQTLALADEHSRSPNETRMRMIWVLDAGLPRPLVNREVFSLDGRLLGVVDLLDVEAGVAGEYDGADHAGAGRRSDDAGREGGLRDHGLEVFRVTGYDMHDLRRVVRRMTSTRDRALAGHLAERRWTITPPPGWPSSPSLDALLDHRDFLRECNETWERERPG